MSVNPRIIAQRSPSHAEDEVVQPSLSPLGRLKALHSEAEETARLANLLGRSFTVAIALPLGALATLVYADRGLAPELSWAVLIGLAAAVMLHAYRRTIRAPFERVALRAFADDLKAILLYAGFAWGAGAFLALVSSADPILTVLFATLACAAVAGLLRSADMVLHFTAPVAALTAAATVLRPLPGGALTGLAVLGACVVVCLVDAYFERRSLKARALSQFGDITLAS